VGTRAERACSVDPDKCHSLETPERRTGPFDRSVYRLRRRVEILVARRMRVRSLATRYDKRAASYRALWTIAMIPLWLGDTD